MTKIEEYIRKNQDQFDSEEPENGHFIRMEQKLSEISTPKRYLRSNTLLKYAAVITLFILAGLGAYHLGIEQQRQEVSQSIFPKKIYLLPEYAEAEVFYTSQIDQKLSFINQYPFSNDSTEKALLDKEIAEMDNLLNNIKNELNANPNDERIVGAAISYYQMKLNVLNKIIEQLKFVEQLNNTNYENANL